jgi:hypothetical protein
MNVQVICVHDQVRCRNDQVIDGFDQVASGAGSRKFGFLHRNPYFYGTKRKPNITAYVTL